MRFTLVCALAANERVPKLFRRLQDSLNSMSLLHHNPRPHDESIQYLQFHFQNPESLLWVHAFSKAHSCTSHVRVILGFSFEDIRAFQNLERKRWGWFFLNKRNYSLFRQIATQRFLLACLVTIILTIVTTIIKSISWIATILYLQYISICLATRFVSYHLGEF